MLLAIRASLRSAVPIVCLATVSRPALAQTLNEAADGVVVAIDKGDLVVDLGSRRGASDGQVAEIWRPLRVKHPVTGKVIGDRFLIGHLRFVQVRQNLSLARPEALLTRDAEPGDVVVLPSAGAARPPAPPTPTTGTLAPTPAGPAANAQVPAPVAIDDEARVLTEIFNSLHGADIEARVRAYESYVSAHPRGRYAAVLWEEAASLRRLLAEPTPAGEEPRPAQATAEAQEIGLALAGEPLRIAVALGGHPAGAVLHARSAGAATYSSLPMSTVGTGYWAATIPAEAIRSPSLEWFVEAVRPDGAQPAVGKSDAPEVAAVEDVRPKAPRALVGQAQIWTDYASFNSKAHNDYVWQTEGVVGARLDDRGIRAVRTGFGVYRGFGGTLQQLDVLNLPPNSVGLTYGYLEGEFGITPMLSIAGRVILGLRDDGVNGGTSAFIRIGSDLETNLLFGGEVLGGIGLRGITQFEWNSFKMFPILLRSEVTNQPAGFGSDVGVRLIMQAGYRVLPHLVVSGRLSYQGRTIDHAGPGVGAEVGYTW